jgi:hypothetical protein
MSGRCAATQGVLLTAGHLSRLGRPFSLLGWDVGGRRLPSGSDAWPGVPEVLLSCRAHFQAPRSAGVALPNC